MTDQVLDILKLVLLALLYLFFARVLLAVWSEVRQPAEARGAGEYVPPTAGPETDAPAGRRTPKPGKGRGGTPARLVVLEPKERRGTAFAISGVVSIGRDDDNTIRIVDDSYISGHHATVQMADGYIVVDDLRSRNGTYLNGTRINAQRTVQAGDRIQVGYTVLEAQ
jgi:pSer/pThr/pTyr-binding forkhead associated (FHA) protein